MQVDQRANELKYNGKEIDGAEVVRLFHQLYYYSNVWNFGKTRFLSLPVGKNPMDLWMYQQLIYHIRPNLIVETGTYAGGSALYLISMMALSGLTPNLVTIDIDPQIRDFGKWPGITQIIASSTSQVAVDKVNKLAQQAKTVMVILDSDHSKEHVLRELEVYAPLVRVGSYMIVEDGNVNGNPVLEEHGPGPSEAIYDFLLSEVGRGFRIDRECEQFWLTFNPGGYLKRVL